MTCCAFIRWRNLYSIHDYKFWRLYQLSISSYSYWSHGNHCCQEICRVHWAVWRCFSLDILCQARLSLFRLDELFWYKAALANHLELLVKSEISSQRLQLINNLPEGHVKLIRYNLERQGMQERSAWCIGNLCLLHFFSGRNMIFIKCTEHFNSVIDLAFDFFTDWNDRSWWHTCSNFVMRVSCRSR